MDQSCLSYDSMGFSAGSLSQDKLAYQVLPDPQQTGYIGVYAPSTTVYALCAGRSYLSKKCTCEFER